MVSCFHQSRVRSGHATSGGSSGGGVVEGVTNSLTPSGSGYRLGRLADPDVLEPDDDPARRLNAPRMRETTFPSARRM
ncbi:hypothetical protein GCM10009785_01460 [Brooklawnia cerclae]